MIGNLLNTQFMNSCVIFKTGDQTESQCL